MNPIRPALKMVSGSSYATKEILIANLISRSAKVVGETGASIEMENAEGFCFFVPQPLTADKRYTIKQLQEIEEQLSEVGIELLPLDYNL